ncbi:FxsA family protein [Brevibacillus daliensis]|uniref:FxsA family protein n=1 Tax=Brevibacillus daliensis TaxID=2892995 RepID=UPI001E5601F4|nr:FxsA family protein [Brevibacillus daliensis]
MKFRVLLILFLTVPIIEIWGIISVGKVIGPLWTIALLILTSVAGAYLAKQQGTQMLKLLQMQLSRGQMPTDTILDGLLLLIGGIMLLFPGFFTDVVGLVFLFPFTRMILRHLLKGWITSMIASGKMITFINFRR